MTCISASTKVSKFGLRVSFQSLWSSLFWRGSYGGGDDLSWCIVGKISYEQAE